MRIEGAELGALKGMIKLFKKDDTTTITTILWNLIRIASRNMAPN